MNTVNNLSPDFLITGGTGLLGSAVCALFEQNGIPYKMSTHRRCGMTDNMVFMDMSTGEGVHEALKNVKVILHLASDKKKPDHDVMGIQYILDELRNLRQDTHLIYISIVGTDRISMPYFRQKWEVEKIIRQSSQHYTILRATQFHKYVESILSQFLKWRISFLPKKIPIQPVDVNPIAAALFRLSQERPANKTIQLGGPEVLKLGDAAEEWLELNHKKKFIINIPLWGSAGKNLRLGALTCRQRADDTLSWTEWLHLI